MLTLSSPAKINLFLKIIDRRSDGFHNLASLFQTIDLSDTLELSLSATDSLTCTDPTIPTDRTNLVSKAVCLFRQKIKLDFSIAINLIKRIPSEAGLGGGSSNAATVLFGLNELCGRVASIEQLSSWASEIGSDVPFFLSKGTAYCTGRGEVVQEIASLPTESLIICKPSEGLSTKEVYGKLDLAALTIRDIDAILKEFLGGRPSYFNDLEMAAFSAMPSLAILKRHLKVCGFSEVLLSGSGSSFFCLGEGSVSFSKSLKLFSSSYINRLPGCWYDTSKSK